MPKQFPIRPATSGFRKVNKVIGRHNSKEVLERFLALDRAVLEIAMHRYKVRPRERSILREETRRLHAALRRTRLKSRLLPLP